MVFEIEVDSSDRHGAGEAIGGIFHACITIGVTEETAIGSSVTVLSIGTASRAICGSKDEEVRDC